MSGMNNCPVGTCKSESSSFLHPLSRWSMKQCANAVSTQDRQELCWRDCAERTSAVSTRNKPIVSLTWLILLGWVISIAAGFAIASQKEVRAANSGCEPNWPPDHAGYATHDYFCGAGCAQDQQILMTKTYEDLQADVECSGSNPSLYLRVHVEVCSGTPHGVLRYRPPGQLNFVSISLDSNGYATSPCFDSCSWPDNWTISLSSGCLDHITVDVGCCECETYDDPCS